MQLRLKSSNILLGGKYKAYTRRNTLVQQTKSCFSVWFCLVYFFAVAGGESKHYIGGTNSSCYFLVYLLGINLVERCADLYRLKSDQFTRSKS